MNFVVVDVASRRKEDYPNMSVENGGNPDVIAAVNARMLSLDEYHDLARRIIGKWAPAHAKQAMLNSEDAIDFVAHHIMIGDWGFNPDKSDITTFRGYCGKMAIRVYIDTLMEQNKLAMTNCVYGIHENNTFDKEDESAVTPDVVEVHLETKEENWKQLQIFMGGLNDTQRKCISMYYFDDIPISEISSKLDMSREGVRKAIFKGLAKIKRMAGVK